VVNKWLRFAAGLMATLTLLSCIKPPAEVETTRGVQPSRLAITIDDLPYVGLGQTSPEEGLAFVQAITKALSEHGIEATGFAVGEQVAPRKIPALNAFAEAGHTIGNHSWSHPNYRDLTADQFR